MSLSPRFRDFALAIAALFAAPSATYAHLESGAFGPLCNGLLHCGMAGVGLLMLGWLVRKA